MSAVAARGSRHLFKIQQVSLRLGSISVWLNTSELSIECWKSGYPIRSKYNSERPHIR